MRQFLKDLFYGLGNQAADLGRILGFVGVMAMVGAQVWNIYLGLPIELDKLGIGLAAVLTASAALVYAKDRAKTEAKAVAAMPAVIETPAPKPKRRTKR